VYFVLDASLWQQFVKLHCVTEKPNVVFTRMIREAVQAKEGSFGDERGAMSNVPRG
jgi:hypothetical protein